MIMMHYVMLQFIFKPYLLECSFLAARKRILYPICFKSPPITSGHPEVETHFYVQLSLSNCEHPIMLYTLALFFIIIIIFV